MSKPNRRWLKPLLIAGTALVALAALGLYAYFEYVRPSGRWAYLASQGAAEETFARFALQPGSRCEGAVFAFPTRGVPIGLWNQSYRFGHHHAGVDIFSGAQPGVTPIYAAYPGYLTRQSDWKSTVIIRVPDDPLNPGRQIWTYYTHMADVEGNSFVSEAFPPGISEVYVEAGTFLGFMGDFSGTPGNPTGVHLHFSVVMDDGQGGFLNELDIENTYDPSPYFNLALDHKQNPNDLPECAGATKVDLWELADDGQP